MRRVKSPRRGGWRGGGVAAGLSHSSGTAVYGTPAPPTTMEHEKDPGWEFLRRSREQALEVRRVHFVLVFDVLLVRFRCRFDSFVGWGPLVRCLARYSTSFHGFWTPWPSPWPILFNYSSAFSLRKLYCYLFLVQGHHRGTTCFSVRSSQFYLR